MAMNRWLLLRLVLPLILAAALLVLAHTRVAADGAFLNLATEFVGIIVTIGYVEWVLRMHERRDWERAEQKIRARIRYTANLAITAVRSALSIEVPAVDTARRLTTDVDYYKAAREVVRPEIRPRLERLNASQWAELIDGLEAASESLTQLLSTFGAKLTGLQYEKALEAQEAIRRAVLPYRAIPEAYGSDLAVKSPADIVTREFNVTSTAEDLNALLLAVCELGESAG